MNVIALHMAAVNDANGNPRRVFVLIDAQTGEVREVVDEGHMGTGALNEFRDKYTIIEGPRFEVTPAAYRDFKRHKRFRPS
jgi:hypothetical protein